MPTIPNATRLDRTQFSGQQAIVNAPTTDLGLKSFGDSVKGVARDMKDVEMVGRQATLDEADLAATIELEGIKRKYENDPDFGTVGERSNADISDKTNEIAGGITNERDRKRWLAAQGAAGLRVQSYLDKAVQVKQRDFNRAAINDQTADLRKAALTSADPGEIRDQYDRRLETAQARGDITAQEREKMSSDFQGQITMDRMQRMDPKNLTQALDDPEMTEHLDPDQLLKLETKRDVETVQNSAVAVVDTAMGKEGATRESVNAEIDAITDPKVRRHAETVARSELAARDSAETEKTTATYGSLDQQIRDGAKLSDIDQSSAWMSLSPGQKNSLTNLEKAESTGTKRTVNNPGVHAEASRLAETKEWRQLDKLLNGYGDQLTGTTRDKYRTAAADGKAPEDVKYNIMVDNAIPGTKKTGDRNAVKVKIADWYDEFSETMQREPTRAEVQAEIDVYTTGMVVDGWFNDRDETYGATDDASMAQHKTLRIQQMQEKDADAYAAAAKVTPANASPFALYREFDAQITLQGYARQTNPEGAARWARIEASVAKRPNVTSQEKIDMYETLRNQEMFE